MITPLKPEPVIVTRFGQGSANARTVHVLYQDVRDEQGLVIPGKQGNFLGVCVRLENGQEVYAQKDQIEDVEPESEVIQLHNKTPENGFNGERHVGKWDAEYVLDA